MMTPQQRAAKTRAVNRDNRRFYEEVSKPAHQKVEKVLNELLRHSPVTMKHVGPFRLKNRATTGRLIAIGFGGLELTILPQGYKHPKRYAATFWDVL